MRKAVGMSAMLPVTPQQFLAELFSSRAAATGAVIRRNARDVDRFVGREAFLAEMRRRGFSVVENAGQLVVFCNREPIRRLT
jgi:hypothetical protein